MHHMFKDASKKFVISLFIEEEDWKVFKREFESLGNQKNVKLIVQPCPYEAIEFLYRVDFNLKGATNSFEKNYFWQAVTLKSSLDQNQLDAISQAHHGYLVAIVQNDSTLVEQCRKKLQGLL